MVNEISRSKYRLENAMESSGFGTRDGQIGLAVGEQREHLAHVARSRVPESGGGHGWGRCVAVAPGARGGARATRQRRSEHSPATRIGPKERKK